MLGGEGGMGAVKRNVGHRGKRERRKDVKGKGECKSERENTGAMIRTSLIEQ